MGPKKTLSYSRKLSTLVRLFGLFLTLLGSREVSKPPFWCLDWALCILLFKNKSNYRPTNQFTFGLRTRSQVGLRSLQSRAYAHVRLNFGGKCFD